MAPFEPVTVAVCRRPWVDPLLRSRLQSLGTLHTWWTPRRPNALVRPPCTTPEGNPAGTQLESNTDRTIVAANGDALSVSTTVTGCGDGLGLTEPEGTCTVTGGTGRFAGATGEGDVSSSVLGGSIDTTWTGTLTY